MARLAAALVTGAVVAMAAAVPPAPGPAVAGTRCVLDDRLGEVSGLAWAPDGLRAVNDSGNASTVYRLGPDCAVTGTRLVATDGRDVEDLARATDGTLWLADTGDNARTRAAVTLLRLPPGGGETVTRLAYPDGPHDVEALLLPADGRPLLVTKELGGRSAVYAPDTPLPASGTTDPVPLRRLADVVVPASSTPPPGPGAIGLLGGGLVTGGAVSPDGRLVVLRTYTDAWLYPVAPGAATADGVLGALAGDPIGVPLPDEPQGEAVTLDPAGTLLSASESPPGQAPGELRAVPAVATPPGGGGGAGVAAPAGSPGTAPVGPADGPGVGPTVPVLLGVVLVVAVGVGLVVRRRHRTR